MTGYFGHPSRRRFILRTVIPFFTVAIVLNLVAAGLLYWSTAEADRIAIERQRALVDLVVSQLKATIAHEQESVTVWDDAVEGIRAGNGEWLDLNLGSWMNTYFGHDSAYIIGPRDQPIYASIEGAVAEPGRLSDIWSQTKPLVDELRGRLRSGDETGISDRVLTIGASEIARVSGRPAIISVKPIVSDSGEIEQVAGEEYFHIAVRHLDDSLVQELKDNYLLDGLRFTWTDDHAPHEAVSPLVDSTGDALGYYVWSPYRPGSVVFGHVWPVLTGMFVIGMGALSGLLLVLRSRSLSLNRTQAEIRHLATHDILTGLPNRVQFEMRLAEALAAAEVEGRAMALLYLDLDRFKEVNDTLGHPTGDMLLRQFAERLGQVVGEANTVVRLGGDEFTIILRGIADQDEVEQICTKLVETARHPFELADTQIFIGVSIGVAIAPKDGTAAIDLTRKADIALYSAKANGRSGYAIFSREMEALITERRELERDLRAALTAPEQFDIHYQPLFAARDHDIAGVEALVRWNHPVRGRISPDVFIPLAEETGLIEQLGELVLRRACAAASDWPVETLAVNVSALEMKSPTYAMRVASILMSTGLSPHRLELEVTETGMSDRDGNCQTNIAALRELGVRFALDDFGTGFSSLGRLQELDVDRIKIDRSFVTGFGTDNGDEAIVRAIIDLAKATGLKTTAEGVETIEQDRFLGEIGCDDLQGFLLSRPIPAVEVEALFADRLSGRHQRASTLQNA
ncbi:MAG: EAL domain-containing protein [Rhizobiaceae bacterium]|nr:EAL domain-containing protein [Rhizobiaceae bacterium]MCV0407431.1 EAL domain-containing protein [Rhizobiaceae bacterium]